jgi:tRNA(fMet)-specific endonuclease VapC
MIYLLDTNILIALANREQQMIDRFKQLQPSEAAMSVISAAELESGLTADPAVLARRELPTRALLRAIPVLALTQDTSEIYGHIVRTVGFNRNRFADLLIAATALEHGLTVITRNVRDFVGIPDLKIEDWL